MNSDDIKKILAVKYREEFFVPEFRDKPAGYNHMIDALAIWLHPSRSSEIECFEIKVNRSDWLKELADVGKSDSIARHCDRIWLVTSDDKIAKLNEIPVNWGWMGVSGKRLNILKDAPKLEPIIDRDFLITVAQYSRENPKFLITDAETRGYDKGYAEGKLNSIPEAERRTYEWNKNKLKLAEERLKELSDRFGVRNFEWMDIPGMKDIMLLAESIYNLKKETYAFKSMKGDIEDLQKLLDGIKNNISKFEEKKRLVYELPS